jgi:hypothetical protein
MCETPIILDSTALYRGYLLATEFMTMIAMALAIFVIENQSQKRTGNHAKLAAESLPNIAFETDAPEAARPSTLR